MWWAGALVASLLAWELFSGRSTRLMRCWSHYDRFSHRQSHRIILSQLVFCDESTEISTSTSDNAAYHKLASNSSKWNIQRAVWLWHVLTAGKEQFMTTKSIRTQHLNIASLPTLTCYQSNVVIHMPRGGATSQSPCPKLYLTKSIDQDTFRYAFLLSTVIPCLVPVYAEPCLEQSILYRLGCLCSSHQGGFFVGTDRHLFRPLCRTYA